MRIMKTPEEYARELLLRFYAMKPGDIDAMEFSMKMAFTQAINDALEEAAMSVHHDTSDIIRKLKIGEEGK